MLRILRYPILCLIIVAVTTISANSQPGRDPGADFKNISAEHNVTVGPDTGLRLRISFTAHILKDKDLYVRLRFRTVADGMYLKDSNKKFYDVDGYAAVFVSLKPGFDETDYNNLEMFIPNSELELGAKEIRRLEVDADVIHSDGEFLSHLTFFPFEYEFGKTRAAANWPKATFTSLSVVDNAEQNAVSGMKMLVSFKLDYMMRIPSYLKISFQMGDGTPIKSANVAYADQDGNLAVFRELLPALEPAEYRDLELFVPYSALGMAKTGNSLQMDLDVIYKQGGTVGHLELRKFTY